MSNKMKKALTYIKDGSFFQHLRLHIFYDFQRLASFMQKAYYGLYDFVSWADKVKDNKIVFSNFCGSGYGGECKYICQYIIEHNMDFELVWLYDKKRVKDLAQFPKQIRLVQYGTFSCMKELSSAHFWIDNCRKDFFPKKKKSQFYLQTWHGNSAIKKIEKDCEDTLPKDYIRDAKKDSKNIDLLIAGSLAEVKIFESCFWYQGKMLESGTCVTDVFFSPQKMKETAQKIREFYKIPQEKKICLYGPSFRNGGSLLVYSLDYKMLEETLCHAFGGEWTIMARLHPNIQEKSKEFSDILPKDVINATLYSDICELLCLADVCISDLSGYITSYFFSKRPTFLFFPDIEDYMKTNRQMYVSPEQLPFPLAKDNETLCCNIKNFDAASYSKKMEEYIKLTGFFEDGNATKRVVEVLQGERNAKL